MKQPKGITYYGPRIFVFENNSKILATDWSTIEDFDHLYIDKLYFQIIIIIRISRSYTRYITWVNNIFVGIHL